MNENVKKRRIFYGTMTNFRNNCPKTVGNDLVHDSLGVVHKLRLQILAFFDPPTPWLTALLNKICLIYLVKLTFHEPPPPCYQRSL